MLKRIVLAFDGGSSAEIARLAADGQTEVVTLTLDAGEGPALEAIRDRALAAGAARAHVVDVRDEFARDYLLPALRAGILADGTASPRPALRAALLERKLGEIGALEGASVSPASPAPNARDAGPRRGAVAETAAHVEIAFAHGAPAALNGVTMPITDLFGSLGTLAAEHGIGAADPVLQAAHTELLRAALPADLVDLARELRGAYAAALASGRWFGPLRTALDAFFSTAQASATGGVRMKLFNGEYAAVETTVNGEVAQDAE